MMFAENMNGQPVKLNNSKITNFQYLIWYGTEEQMSFIDLASYCAPVFWFSPDEPELLNKSGKEITIPSEFPFEKKSDTPVVYYQISEILLNDFATGKPVKKDYTNNNKSIIDLSKVSAFQIDYSHYYQYEAGLGTHKDDTEQSQFNYAVRKKKIKEETYYLIYLVKAVGKAHALVWFDNIFALDESMTEVKLPFHILVEEGKHASCTDANADGYYTPGYDVNVRTNDAWGMRDVIRTGELFSSEYESYMSKVRRPEHRIFPPLPDDSHLKERYSKDSIYSPENAVYELRPMPDLAKAMKYPHLMKDMEAYTALRWPKITDGKGLIGSRDWFEKDLFLNSFAVSAMYDGDVGVSFMFPLLIVKNVQAPIIGGWLVNRIYLKDYNLRDVGYDIVLTPSASRFMDPYFAVGIENDKEPKEDDPEKIISKGYFVIETGIKLRANVKFSPLKFLSFLTDYWGIRLGVKNKGFPDINNLQYNIELGAGVW